MYCCCYSVLVMFGIGCIYFASMLFPLDIVLHWCYLICGVICITVRLHWICFPLMFFTLVFFYIGVNFTLVLFHSGVILHWCYLPFMPAPSWALGGSHMGT